MSILSVGDLAPDFSLPSVNSNISLSSLRGKMIVLYFYPKDDTPGCTIEAQDFNNLKPEFDAYNSVIIGISKDTVDSHAKFQQKYCLNFDLVSDNDSDVCQKYGVWSEKSMFGKKYMGINRATFLIDRNGKILKIWPKVSISGHAEEVLNVVISSG